MCGLPLETCFLQGWPALIEFLGMTQAENLVSFTVATQDTDYHIQLILPSGPSLL